MNKPITPERLEEIARWIYHNSGNDIPVKMIEDLQQLAERMRNANI